MKRSVKKSFAIVAGCLLIFAAFLSVGTAHALTTAGTPIIAIDGDNDSNVTVDVFSVALTSPYVYGYFVNAGPTFYALGALSTVTFDGGDLIDFALYDYTRYYTLSGDSADASYSVTMTFGNQVTAGSPANPAGWSSPYYYNANITWTLSSVINTNELALNFRNGNDGLAPVSVPEPLSLILLGSGLVGVGLAGRRFKG